MWATKTVLWMKIKGVNQRLPSWNLWSLAYRLHSSFTNFSLHFLTNRRILEIISQIYEHFLRMRDISWFSNITSWYHICVPSNSRKKIVELEQIKKFMPRSTRNYSWKLEKYKKNLIKMIPPARILSHYLNPSSENLDSILKQVIVFYCCWTNLAPNVQKSSVSVSKCSFCIKSTTLTMQFLKHMMTAASYN